MSYGAGSLALTARRAGQRTVLERIRYDGISRCSRAFAHADAALVVLSQLGPGVVRGDTRTTSGRVGSEAHLIVTSQSATRLMGGTHPSHSHATWSLDDRAVLELLGEPLVASTDASHESSTTIELGAGSFAVMTELACVPASADVRLRTCVRRAGRELFYDAFDAAAAAPQAVGTFAVVGLADDCIGPLVGALDRTADAFNEPMLGVGTLPTGAFARMLAADIWGVRSILLALRAAAWTVLVSGQRAGGVMPAVGSSSPDGRAASSRAVFVT